MPLMRIYFREQNQILWFAAPNQKWIWTDSTKRVNWTSFIWLPQAGNTVGRQRILLFRMLVEGHSKQGIKTWETAKNPHAAVATIYFGHGHLVKKEAQRQSNFPHGSKHEPFFERTKTTRLGLDRKVDCLEPIKWGQTCNVQSWLPTGCIQGKYA